MSSAMIAPYNLTVIQPNVRTVFTADGRYQPEVIQENLEHACDLIYAGSRYFKSKLFVLPEFFLHGFQRLLSFLALTYRLPKLPMKQDPCLHKCHRRN